MNKVCLYGRVADEPHFGIVEKNGFRYCAILLELDVNRKDLPTIFVPVLMYGEMAETAARIITEGYHLGVEGRLGLDEYKGQKRLTVIATRLSVEEAENNIAARMIHEMRRKRKKEGK